MRANAVSCSHRILPFPDAGYFFLILCLFITTPVMAEKPTAPEQVTGTVRVDADQVIMLITSNPDLVVIDARKEAEYIKGHIQDAVSLLNVDMTAEKLAQIAPDKSTPLLFYCNGERCLRSSKASARAVSWGYKTVYWFRGGWNEWLKLGLPISQ